MKDVLVVGLFLSLGQFALMYTAIWLDMPPGLASLVLQAQVSSRSCPRALALRERPTPPQLVGGLLGAAGLVIVGLGGRPRRRASRSCSRSAPRRRGRRAT